MRVAFSVAMCRAMKQAFISWDWSPGKYSGGEAYRDINRLVWKGSDSFYQSKEKGLKVGHWGVLHVHMLIGVAKVVLIQSDFSGPPGMVGKKKHQHDKSLKRALFRRVQEVVEKANLPDLDRLNLAVELGRLSDYSLEEASASCQPMLGSKP